MKNSHSRLSKVIAIVLTLVMLIGIVPVSAATPIGSSDQGDGTYTNPVIWADVPDLDIIRVGDTYWMSSTTMHMCPGVPIMKSYDLVNWETVSYCYYALEDMDSMKLQTGNNMYGNGTWASSLRYKDGTFYCVVPSATHIYSKLKILKIRHGVDMKSIKDSMTAAFYLMMTAETGCSMAAAN